MSAQSSPSATPADEAAVQQTLHELLAQRWAEPFTRLQQLAGRGRVADETAKFIMRGENDAPCGFVILSSAIAPRMIADAVARSRRIADVLQPATRAVIEAPVVLDQVQGRSFAAYYFRHALGPGLMRRLQRWWVKPRVMHWLNSAIAQTMREPDARELEQRFTAPLEHIASSKDLDGQLRDAARNALQATASRQWQPQLTLMHNDLWSGNVLLAPRSETAGHGFVIIDWAGSHLNGVPCYDLLRMARSFGVSPRTLKYHLTLHCRTLDCRLDDTWGYTLAALGGIGLAPGEFPRDRWIRLTRDTCATLADVVR